MSERRWTRDRWLSLGERRLKEAGPQALGLEAICEAAGRTRGSFYHHFPTTEAFVAALVARWRARTTDGIGEVALASRNAETASKTLMRLAAEIDPRLDMAIRTLGVTRPEVAAEVEAMDERREAIIAELLVRIYGLDPARALAGGRLFHSIYLAAQVRRPDDLRGFIDGPFALLFETLKASARPPA
ncbi:MAG: TetR/AcrR family transcriptional regulator [Caulobacteraceae bacterium]|nr:TetR/AcrR family transcriptional regulator [Caulobacteraceae bacterium]